MAAGMQWRPVFWNGRESQEAAMGTVDAGGELDKWTVIEMAIETADGRKIHKSFATLDEAMAYLIEVEKEKVAKREEARQRVRAEIGLRSKVRGDRDSRWQELRLKVEEVGKKAVAAHSGPEEPANIVAPEDAA